MLVILRPLFVLLWALFLALPVWAQAPRVMFVAAHPDDDSMATGTLSQLGPNVSVVCLSRGESGGNAVGHEAGPALGILREGEQRKALTMLGIGQLFHLQLADFGFTLSAEATEWAWNKEATLEHLVRYFRVLRPEVVFTLHPSSGHGHHQYAARRTAEAFRAAADPMRFPQQLAEEGLTPWQPQQLYFAAEGCLPELEVEVSPEDLEREVRALQTYRSQGWDKNSAMPQQGLKEGFVLGYDLSGHGLSGYGLKVSQTARTAKSVPQDGPRLVLPPARASLVDWTREFGLERLLDGTPPLYPVGLGESVTLQVQHGQESRTYRFRGQKLGRVPLEVEGFQAELAVVPSGRLPVEASLGPQDLWEGEVTDSRDLSADFTAQVRDGQLEVDLEVSDDVVLSNLSTRDNRSHWRTDSVEIAIDPHGPGQSMHSLQTIKIGIVPFTSEGQLMAARDADADPGPVSRTLPGFRAQAQRTAVGYRLAVRIPLKDLGLKPNTGFGFNLLIYDADNPKAQAGENANQGRIAWSAWPAVQGDPQLWGRLYP